MVTVEDYLAALDDQRRELVGAIRDVVNTHLPVGYREAMQYGMIGWSVPHELYPAGYHTDPTQPLPYAALASQKRYVSLYLMGLYIGNSSPGSVDDEEWFRERWAATGRRLDMGKSCVRMRSFDDVAFDVIGDAIARLPVAEYIARYDTARPTTRRRSS